MIGETRTMRSDVTSPQSEKPPVERAGNPSDGKPQIVDGARDLLLKMYDTLREEIAGFMKELGALTTSGILATSGIWTWVITNYDRVSISDNATISHKATIERVVLTAFLFLPTILAGLFFIRVHALRVMIHTASDHIALIEQHFGIDSKLGWDSFWRERREQVERGLLESVLGFWLYLIWSFLLIVNLFAALVLTSLWFKTVAVAEILDPLLAKTVLSILLLFYGIFFLISNSCQRRFGRQCTEKRKTILLLRENEQIVPGGSANDGSLSRIQKEEQDLAIVVCKRDLTRSGLISLSVGLTASIVSFLLVISETSFTLIFWITLAIFTVLPLLITLYQSVSYFMASRTSLPNSSAPPQEPPIAPKVQSERRRRTGRNRGKM